MTQTLTLITDTSSPDQLSFTGLIRQINTGISKGYKPEEICEGVIRSIQCNQAVC